MIEIKNLSVTYQSEQEVYTALQDVRLCMEEGGTCAVVGPSGCGKSTLLKVLAGIITDYEGSVEIGGAPLSPFTQRIGFIGQGYGLLPWKNVEDNICLGIKIKEKGGRIDKGALASMMKQLGIEGLGKRYPAELSGGQQQRVSLARAFLLRPDILLMDEPFSALDAITREEIQDLFFAVWKKHAVSTILVTHYVEEAVYLGQKIVILSANPGRIRKVIENPLFGKQDIRRDEAFFSLSLALKQQIKEEWA